MLDHQPVHSWPAARGEVCCKDCCPKYIAGADRGPGAGPGHTGDGPRMAPCTTCGGDTGCTPTCFDLCPQVPLCPATMNPQHGTVDVSMLIEPERLCPVVRGFAIHATPTPQTLLATIWFHGNPITALLVSRSSISLGQPSECWGQTSEYCLTPFSRMVTYR